MQQKLANTEFAKINNIVNVLYCIKQETCHANFLPEDEF